MAWLGLFTLIIFYWCFFTAAVTGRRSWIWLSILCLPVLIMVIGYKEGMQINGLIITLCAFMFIVCRSSLKDILLWNQKRRRYHWILLVFLWLICFLFLFYSIVELQISGYLWDFQGWNVEKRNSFRITITTLPIVWISYYYGEMFYNSVDRKKKKKSELILIACNFFIANNRGGDTGIDKGYFLDGVNNGINYHFRMTKGTYIMLQRERALRLKVQRGLLGGYYVLENPCPDNMKKTLKRDRKNAKIGIVLFLFILIFGIILFFFPQILYFWK